MELLNNFVFRAVAFVLLGGLRLLVTLNFLLGLGAISVVPPIWIDTASICSSVMKR
jgi:hypothetical protein